MYLNQSRLTMPMGDEELEEDPCGSDGMDALGGGTPMRKRALAAWFC